MKVLARRVDLEACEATGPESSVTVPVTGEPAFARRVRSVPGDTVTTSAREQAPRALCHDGTASPSVTSIRTRYVPAGIASSKVPSRTDA